MGRRAAQPREVPERLLRGFFRVDDPLLVSRYREALRAIGAPPGERLVFHIDAAGYSPELAADLDDPYYLGLGAPAAHAVIVSVEQLGAPFVHPGLGYAAEAYRQVTSASKSEISGITLREPLIADTHAASGPLAGARELADLSDFEIRFRTPGGLVVGARRLESLKAEFLESSRRWLDDEFIRELAGLAREVRDLGQLSDRFVASRHKLGPFFSAAFGGSYVLEEAGQSRRAATTTVLASDPGAELEAGDAEQRSARGRRVRLARFEPASAMELLLRHEIARLDVGALRRNPDSIVVLQHWIAVDHLLALDPERPLQTLGPGHVSRHMRGAADAPDAYRELEDVRRRIGSRSDLDAEALSPATRLRLLTPTSRREAIRRFVRHVQASADPLHLERGWRDAPDVFFGRLPGLSEARRTYFARWLDAEAGR